MNRISDDILNKYLDNELDSDTRKKVELQLEFSEEDRRNYNALKMVHSGLKNINSFEVSNEFTSTVLRRLLKKTKAKKEQSVFILSVSSVFILLSLIVVGVSLSLILGIHSGPSSSGPVMDNFVSIINNASAIISRNLTGKNISILGSVISFGIIISGYFFFENHKHIKEIK